MCFESVQPDEKLLDIGIGTGLASMPFATLGLYVYGLDASEAMLSACQPKSFTQELRRYDMAEEPLPYPDAVCDHAISCGALHFIGNLAALFKETYNMVFSTLIARAGSVHNSSQH